MNSSSNLLVLGVTGQVGKLVANNLERTGANFSVGSRRKANLEELADHFGASRFIDLDEQQFVTPKVSKTIWHSLIQHLKQRMQREDSNCSVRSRTEEWRTLEA